MLKIYGLRCESMVDPMGIDVDSIRLSWKLCGEGRGLRQTAYRVQIAEDGDPRDIAACFDTGRVESQESSFTLEGFPLKSRGRYGWRVTVWDGEGAQTASELARWEMGLTGEGEWDAAKWMEPVQKPMFEYRSPRVMWEIHPEIEDEDKYVPCQLIRGEFEIADKPVRAARAYASAHGVYLLALNGRRAGDIELAPEATPYDKYLQYQTYDITGLLRSGRNCAGMHISTGWWSGLIGLFSASCQYGDKVAGLLKIVVEYADGEIQTIDGGEGFRSAESPVRYGEMKVGERYDPAYEQTGWSLPGFDDSAWTPVNCPEYPKDVLRGQNAEPIRVIERRKAQRVFTAPNGDTLIDFGQVMAGKARIRLRGPAGTVVKFHYTEELGTDGNYARNVSGPYNQDTDTWILRGDADEVYEPKFVYHGFRYIKVTGIVPALEDIEALVMASGIDCTGSFACSDPRVTRLHENVLRTALGNFVSIPTDNPDRERGGWTGDAQMFVDTACYVVGLEAFWRRWLEEMRLEQHPDGQVPSIVPNWRSYDMSMTHHGEDRTTSSAWGDACILLPWTAYSRYGDLRILRDNYPMMRRWMEYVRVTAETKNPPDVGELTPERAERLKYMWNTGFHYGDWLTPSDCTDENGNFQYLPNSLPLSKFTPSCYYAQSAELMGRIAALLGEREDAEFYTALAGKVRAACTAEYFDETGATKENRQGAQVFSLYFDIAPEGHREDVLNRLVKMIEDNDGLMDTGFSSTQYLLDVLADNGRVKEAYDRLFCNRPPSWLYEVEKGATAIWESWQGIMPDGTVNAVSFIQYANGVVGGWLYRGVCGIRAAAPGFRRIELCPLTDERLSWAKARYESVQGPIESGWARQGDEMTLTVEIPANTTATVRLPGAVKGEVLEGGVPAKDAPGVAAVRAEDGRVEIEIGSGRYEFRYRGN